MTLPGSRTVTYGHDDAGRVTSLTDWQSRQITLGYNAAGQRTSVSRPNGVATAYGYDTGGRLNAITQTNGGVILQSYGYTLDAAGNRTAVTTSAGTETYTLDALNRLTGVTYANSDVVAYTYDAQGNRLTEVVNSVTTQSNTYDSAGELTSDGTRSYTYDGAGNLLTAGSDSFTWDYANRMVSSSVAATSATYAYDGDGVRVGQTTGGVTTSYLWDRPANGSPRTGCSCNQANGAPLPLLVDDGSKAYLQYDGLLAEIDGSNVADYPLTDALGSVRGLTDGAGTESGTADYAAFGAVRSATGATSGFGFTGEQRDATTGLTYLRARYLDSGTGRFTAADSVQPNAPGTQGWGLYAYAADNPASLIDPSGHAPFCPWTIIVAGLAVAVITLAIGLIAFGIAQVSLNIPLATLAATVVTSAAVELMVFFGLMASCLVALFVWAAGQAAGSFAEGSNTTSPNDPLDLTQSTTQYPVVPSPI
jgi:RHS repeat-associated protein